MNYFFSYYYIMGTGAPGFGNCILTIDRSPKDQKDINFISEQIKNKEFDKATAVAVVITNFIKL